MAIPTLTIAGLSALAGAGAASGEGGMLSGFEIGTSKKESLNITAPTTTDIRETSTQETFAPSVSRDISIITRSPNANMTTKKEQISDISPSSTQAARPYVSPIISPTQAQGQGAGSADSGESGGFSNILIIGGLGVLAYSFLKKKK